MFGFLSLARLENAVAHRAEAYASQMRTIVTRKTRLRAPALKRNRRYSGRRKTLRKTRPRQIDQVFRTRALRSSKLSTSKFASENHFR